MKRKKRTAESNAIAATAAPKTQDTPRAGRLGEWALTGVLLAAAVVGGVPGTAMAQSSAPTTDARQQTRRFDIPSGKLSDVVAAFARSTGLQLLDPSGAIGDQSSAGVSGTLTVDDALRAILNGSGVTYRFANARTVRLQKGDLGPNRLANVTVVGSRVAEASSSKYTEPVRDIPQTITVVPKEVLASQGVTSLRDAVRNVTGLTVNAGEGGATPGDNFNIRGFSARSDIFVNGIRDVGGYSRETFNIEQIEVTKGPGSVYSGRGSTGGSINLVTKTPNQQRAYSGALAAGTADYKRTTLDFNQPLDSVGLKGVGVRLNAQWQDAGVPGLDVIKNKSYGVAPSIAIGLGSSTQLTLEYMKANQDNIPTYGYNATTGTPPDSVDTHDYFGIRNLDFERVRTDQGALRITHAFGNGATLRNNTAVSQSDVHRIVSSANADGSRRSPSHITFDHNVTNQTLLTTPFRTGNVEHAVVSGLDVSSERSRFAAYVFTGALPRVNLTNPSPSDAFTGTYREGRPRRSAQASAVGIYTFDTMKLGEKFELSGGLRYDSFTPQYRDSLDVELPKHESTALTWRTGAVYKPQEAGSIYFAYGTSFNPSGETLSLDSRGSLSLDPEESRSIEVGTKWSVAGSRLLFTTALFRTDKTNARITDPTDPSGATLILAGEQRVQGGEVGASGMLTDTWSLFAGWTYLDGKILKGNAGQDGTVIPNTPKHTLNIWSTGRLPWEMEIGGGVRYVGERLRSATQNVPAYWSYDADVMMPVGRNVEVRANFINLTDATYYDSGRFWVPASGRAVRVTTNLKF